MRTISLSAVVVGFFLGFVVPYALVFAIGPAMSFFSGQESITLGAWFTLLWLGVAVCAPVAAGYLAARLGRVQPLLHGAAAGLLGVIAGIALSHSLESAAYTAMIFGSGGLVGGWLWRTRSHGNSAL